MKPNTLHVETVKKLFEGVRDTQDCPYYLHCLRVGISARDYVYDVLDSITFRIFYQFQNETDELFQLGIYHDVFEDTDMTFDELALLTSYTVALNVLFLSRPDEKVMTMLDASESIKPEHYRVYSQMFEEKLNYQSWIERLIELALKYCISHDVIIVKFMDQIDNSLKWRSRKILGFNKKYDQTKPLLEDCIHRLFKLGVYANET